ncbi:prolyl 3-hydroxylase /prolyl 3,4-dihydroxylase [Enteropsectra breve]|nr:prolyl 3-hydroxylase /prolyl 3,4-dihydroxylase [Enteropsectra breve]
MAQHTQSYEAPYFHAIIDDFLADKDHEALLDYFHSCKFTKVCSDLYHFYQTAELNSEAALDKFKSELDVVFGERMPLDNRYYNIFGSLYKKDDYLLCHDDLIDDRVFAFTYYLEDFQSGELAIYENDCETLNKEIKIRKNRLVIFKVGASSFHEVKRCLEDGRKAVSGWFNIKNTPVPESHMAGTLQIPTDPVFFDLEHEFFSQRDSKNEYVHTAFLDFEDLSDNVVARKPSGPFISRRCTSLKIEPFYVPRIEGYEPVNAEVLAFDSESYILVNDKINVEEKEILDIIVFKGSIEDDLLVKCVGSSGEVIRCIPFYSDSMILVLRKNINLCIFRDNWQFEMKHFMYIRND